MRELREISRTNSTRIMNTYLIVAEEDYKNRVTSGILLSIEKAPNPEDAMNQWANKIIDDDFLELAKETKQLDVDNITPEKRVDLSLQIVNSISNREFEAKIYQATVDENGKSISYTLDDLEFSNHQSYTSAQQ